MQVNICMLYVNQKKRVIPILKMVQKGEKTMKKKIRKISLLMAVLLLLTWSFSVSAETRSAPGPVDPGTGAGCIYQATHGKHNPHASNFKFRAYSVPDYTVGKVFYWQYYECTECGYYCCYDEGYFGTVITADIDSKCSQ